MMAVADCLDGFWAKELGCTLDALLNGGVSFWSPSHRGTPRWMGWIVPLEVIKVDRAAPDTGVISVTPMLQRTLRNLFDAARPVEEYLPPDGKALRKFVRTYLAPNFPKIHRILCCDAATFIPAPDPLPVSELHDDDPHAAWFRMHFDGPVFTARDQRGAVASWAAIKCKADDVWEMAVMTEPGFRCRGLARSVTSHATRAALDHGKIAMYLHDISNHASAKVCRALGYQPYGYELTCESGRIMPRQ